MSKYNKKILSSFFILLCLSFGVKSQGIEFFHGSFDEAKALAKSENKPLFIDVYTSWCGPCKKLSKTIFPQKSVGDYFNKNFVCFKLQADKKGGENQKIADHYKVAAYPTLMWLNGKGELLHVSIGFKEPDRLIAEAKVVFDEDKRVGSIVEKWNKGDRSLPVVSKYFAFDRNSNGEFDDYFKGLSQKEKLDSNTFKILSDVRLNLEGEVFGFVVKHRSDYLKVSSPWYVQKAIDSKVEKYLEKSFGSEKFEEMLKKYKSCGIPDVDLYAKKAEWMYCLKIEDYSAFDKSAKEYINDFSKKRPYVYSELIRNLFYKRESGRFNEFKNRKIAIEWVNILKKNYKDPVGLCIEVVQSYAVAGDNATAKKVGAEYLKKLSEKKDESSDFYMGYLTDILKQIK